MKTFVLLLLPFIPGIYFDSPKVSSTSTIMFKNLAVLSNQDLNWSIFSRINFVANNKTITEEERVFMNFYSVQLTLSFLVKLSHKSKHFLLATCNKT